MKNHSDRSTPEQKQPELDAAIPKNHGRGRLAWWALVLVVALASIFLWRVMDQRAAVREARAAGIVVYGADPFKVIREDWYDAFRWDTWERPIFWVAFQEGASLSQFAGLLRRLRPQELGALGCKDSDLRALRGLSSLKGLHLQASKALKNVDSLCGITGLQSLSLRNCTSIGSDALRQLSKALPKTNITYPDGRRVPP